MAQKTVFDFKHYRDYLKTRLRISGPTRGLRSKLALKIYTRPAFVTQVLTGVTDLSPEHIPATNELLGHTEEESHYFTQLVLLARSGNHALKSYYEKQIAEIQSKRKIYLDRIKPSETISLADQSVYYSQWIYQAIHVLASIPQYQTKDAMSARLSLPTSVISDVVEKLLNMGLLDQKGNRYLMGKKRIYLRKDSAWISNLHTHLRQRALQSLAAPDRDDLHFSQVMSISKEDYDEFRRRLLDLIGQFEPVFAESKEEELFSLGFDLFKY